MTDRCEQCGQPVETGCHLELEHPETVGTAFLARDYCPACADQAANLLELVGTAEPLRFYWCPVCDHHDIATAESVPETCTDCGADLEEKPLTPSTVFSNARRTNARVIS